MGAGRTSDRKRDNGAGDRGGKGGVEGGLEVVQRDEIKEMLDTLTEKTDKLKEYL
jgi:hypothetical protein